MIRFRSIAALLIALGAIAFSVPGFTSQNRPTTGAGTDRADALYAEGSYRLAHQAYAAVDQQTLDEEDLLRLRFRLADSLWRSRATDTTYDPSITESARQELRDLLRIYEDRQHDHLFALIHESLGDSYWNRAERNWSAAWNHYEMALEYWAGSTDLDLARERYLEIVRTAADPPEIQPWEIRGQHAQSIPLPVIENAVEIATSPDDRAHMNFLLAMRLRYAGEPALVERGLTAFETTLAQRYGNTWYDDALFHYAETLEQRGRLVYRDGRWQSQPDPAGALTLYRRLLSEFTKGETRYHDQATSRIRTITAPSLGVHVTNIFLPGSRVRYQLRWRNVSSAEIEIWKVDLTSDLQLAQPQNGEWLENISLNGATRIEATTRRLESEGPHLPGSETVTMQRELPVGAYVLRARSGAIETRELILVTDIAVVTKTAPHDILAFVADARTGAPIPGARVRAWEEYHHNGRRQHRAHDAVTGADGVAIIERQSGQSSRQVFVAVNRDGRQAYASGWAYTSASGRDQWRIYAVTDRPAYRPEETVQWMITARVFADGRYATPAEQQINYEIFDPRGNKVNEGSPILNRFGSTWASLDLDESMPLGMYTIRFENEKGESIGSAILFRLEEYKLPEYQVSVTPADSGDGSARLHRLGDRVEVEIAADYYFGGPVANATVEVVVHQKPWYPGWHWPRRYPWYFEQPGGHDWYGQGEEVLNETLTTGPDGRARFGFETPDGGQDLEYTIEARVTDSSRREITGSASVRVTAQPFYAHMKPRSVLHRPGDRVEVDLRTIDANDRPVAADGELVITRETWREIWIDPRGRKVTGSDLEKAKRNVLAFPPPQEIDQHPWRLIERGYEKEEIARLSLSTNDDGEATHQFIAPREGFYRLQWTSEVGDNEPVRPRDVVSTETTVWVADRNTRTLGYRASGIELIVASDSFESGTTVPVMIVTESAGTHVLFTVEREQIFEHRVVATRGNVTLVELELSERDIPNIFFSATTVRDLALSADTEEIVVPPTGNFIDLSVELDRDQYEPRDRGRVTITTRNSDGEPIPAAVSLAVADESVYYIQEDLAGDPRQFFYGSKLHNSVQTTSSFQQKSYVKLVETEDGELDDERQIALGREEKGEAEERATGGVVGGVIGGVIGSPAPPQAPSAVAESITVTSDSSALRQSMAKSADEIAGPGDAVMVRSDFRSTAFWQPDIVTDETGTASVAIDWPDSLTTWRATARAATTGADFGIATAAARTKKPLIVRLQAPRFFVVGDETVISAIVNNYTEHDLPITPGLEIDGLEILGSVVDGGTTALRRDPVTVPAGGEERLEWLVAAREAGTATINVRGVAGEMSDAMQRQYLVWDHGIEKLVGSSGKVHGDASEIRIDLPRERRPGSTEMSVTVTPSVAITMLDAIPYLIDYPYGCTEQTMSRFLPAAIVSKTLEDLGVSRQAVASRIFGGIEPQSADATHPKGRQDLAALDDVMARGLARLYDFQHADGSWGWWKEGSGDHFMTGYVVWGLSLASEGGIPVRSGVIDRAVNWLDRELVEEEQELNRQAWMLHAVTAAQPGVRNEYRDRAFANLWKGRDSLTSYGLALFALSAHQLGNTSEAQKLVRNLENGVAYDDSPDQSVVLGARPRRTDDVMATAHWGSESFWWRWYDGPVETTAFVLRALVTIDPDHRLVEPAMNWLVRNRRGAQWNNTRDTAVTILALNEYLEQSGELSGNASYVVSVNGAEIGRGDVSPATMLTARSRFTVPDSAIRDGHNQIRVARTGGQGDQSLYFSVEARYYSTEEPITAEGNEIFVRREYFRLVPRKTLLRGMTHDRVPLRDGESVRSGERIDVVLTVETKNDYEYLIFEDLKPAGFEAVQIRSGERLYARQLRSDAVAKRFESKDAGERRRRTVAPSEATGITRWLHQELRDRKVVMFADRLDQGVWEIRYELRAEVPGSFHALPLIGEAMYVPEIRANGEEMRVEVVSR